MQNPVKVSFDGLDHSVAVEERIQEKVTKLEQFCDDIISCRVTISRHRKNKAMAHRKGEPYLVTIHVKVPGSDLIVNENPDDELRDHEDVGIALRDAFHAMERQLKTYVERRH